MMSAQVRLLCVFIYYCRLVRYLLMPSASSCTKHGVNFRRLGTECSTKVIYSQLNVSTQATYSKPAVDPPCSPVKLNLFTEHLERSV